MLKIFYRFTLQKYVLASRIGGISTDNLYQTYKDKYINTAIEQVKKSNNLKGITIVTTPNQCKRCLEILLNKTKNKITACDTQTIDLDPKRQSPVGHGHIICMSIFGGPEINFGNGPRLFIDNFGLNAGLIDILKPYLENEEYLKVWHNYGFDRHLFYNHGINIRGFGGDTMHMARLFDASKGPKEYSLTRLTQGYKRQIQKTRQKYIQNLNNQINKKLAVEGNQSKRKEYIQELQNLLKYQKQYSHTSLKKIKIQDLFKRKKTLISGKQGKTYEYPSVLTLHTDTKYISQWIKYSILDSESTFFLRQTLERFLKIQQTKLSNGIKNMWELYIRYWRPFGQLLTDMERTGIKINLQHIEKIKQKAIQHSENKRLQFLQFIESCQKSQNIDLFNPSSARQMQQFLHAPFEVKRNQKKVDQAPQQEYEEDLENEQEDEDIFNDKVVNRKIITQLPQIDQFNVRNTNSTRGNKILKMAIKGLGIPPVHITPTGLPSVDFQSIKSLAGNPKQKSYGQAYNFFKSKGNQEFGIKLCQALDTLIQYRNIQTLLKTFIEPLKDYGDEGSRIHCSLNINTQTGRLSARKPNLQNQPALQKDIYKIRYAFEAEKGNKLIVADYGQLQLRILAHITNCKAMIDAFKQGGDFHSRTAIGMFPYIKQQIQKGLILLEWDKSKGAPPVPLLKDKFTSQRRKAKTMNFSIAYGKTAHGFAQDWNCSIEQAKESLQAWFRQRQQVRKWQNQKKKIAQVGKYTQTLLGRYRYLYKYFQGSQKVKMNLRNMAFRRAINTPIQGGAADIVIAAMVKIHQNQRLRQMNWKLLLQIHDELILEGPQQNSKQALEIVKFLMENPLDEKLLINLEVDAKIGNNWYQCK